MIASMSRRAVCIVLLALTCSFVQVNTEILGVVEEDVKLVMAPIGSFGKHQEWDDDVAKRLTKPDVTLLVLSYEQKEPLLLKIMEEYQKTRLKDSGIRMLANWGNALAHLYDLGVDKGLNAIIYKHMVELAELLLTAQETTHSYVENTIMRGWPMYVDPTDKEQTYDAFNAGSMGLAVAQAARAAALERDHVRAAAMITPVLEALYDGFLTSDKRMTKLDDKYRVVYVPNDAPAGRKRRHKEVTKQGYCLDLPQAYNHGLLVARAAMATWRAVKEINWSEANWTFAELERNDVQKELTTLIRNTAQWLRKGMTEKPPAGSNPLDNYPGKFGASWLVWEYRDYTGCDLPDNQKHKYRAEDIAHATHDIAFITEYRQWQLEKYVDVDMSGDIFGVEDMHRLVVTFLNRVVHDYDKTGSEKFACDVLGVYDDSDWGVPWKQCSGSRSLEERAHFAAAWLPLVYSVRNEINLAASMDDKRYSELHCDALRMIDTVLPMTFKGSDEYYERFDFNDLRWGYPVIETKHAFYNYKVRMETACEFEKLVAAVPISGSISGNSAFIKPLPLNPPPSIEAPSLESVSDATSTISGSVTQPNRRPGRRMAPKASVLLP